MEGTVRDEGMPPRGIEEDVIREGWRRDEWIGRKDDEGE